MKFLYVLHINYTIICETEYETYIMLVNKTLHIKTTHKSTSLVIILQLSCIRHLLLYSLYLKLPIHDYIHAYNMR